MWFTYPLKVNVALASMAIPPKAFDSAWRSEMQQFGYAAKLTPQETALLIVSQGMGINYPMDVETAIGVWRLDRKIDLSKPIVIEALGKMGFNTSGL